MGWVSVCCCVCVNVCAGRRRHFLHRMTVDYGKLWANTLSRLSWLWLIVENTLSTSLPQSDGSASPEDASFSPGCRAEVGGGGATFTRSEKVTQKPFADVCRDAAGVKPQEEEEEEEERKDNSISGSADCAEGVTDSRMYPQHCTV